MILFNVCTYSNIVPKHVKIPEFLHFEFLHLMTLMTLTVIFTFEILHPFLVLLKMFHDVLFLIHRPVSYLLSFIYSSKYSCIYM